MHWELTQRILRQSNHFRVLDKPLHNYTKFKSRERSNVWNRFFFENGRDFRSVSNLSEGWRNTPPLSKFIPRTIQTTRPIVIQTGVNIWVTALADSSMSASSKADLKQWQFLEASQNTKKFNNFYDEKMNCFRHKW
jgi:hypothetical protein